MSLSKYYKLIVMIGGLYMNDNINFIGESGPTIVAFDVTGMCNFKCLHCYNDSGQPLTEELSDAEALDVAKQIADLKPINVCICGGEPLLRKNVCDIVKIIAECNAVVNMVSNGSLLNEELLINLKNAGLDTIQISLDGINYMQHDTFRGYKGAFEKAVNAIKLCTKIGIPVMTSFSPNKLNYKYVNEYFELCNDLGVTSARVMPIIPMGRGSKMDRLLLSADDYTYLQLQIEKCKNKFIQNNMQVEWGDPLEHYYRMPINAKAGLKTLTMEIKANGNLTISTYLPIVVGNVRKHTLKEYWNGGYKNLWERKEITDYISKIENIYDINNLDPKPYSGEFYYIDIL